MKSKTLIAALLSSSMLAFAAPAFAQGNEADTRVQPDAPQSNEDLAARAAFLEAQVQAMQEQLDELKSQVGKNAPSWKGMPQFEDKDAGWSFKPRGRIQYDVGMIENPNSDATGADAIATKNLGFNARVRRIRLGAEGTVPGGFGYKFEMDFANAATAFGDAIITYAPAGKPFSFTIGNHETMDGLEQITSSRFTSFMERAQMNDAFVNTRRLGVSFGLVDKTGQARFNAGLFSGHSIDGSLDNDGYIAAARATYSPLFAGGMIHLGANVQFRHFQSNDCTSASAAATCPVAAGQVGAPSTNQLARYRARPFLQTTDVRFVDTGAFAAKSDMVLGGELAGIFKSFHFAGEAQYVKVNAYAPGDISTGLDAFNPTNVALVPSDDPNFFSWYGEVGYFLTGETRGYKNGLWDRTKVLHPFSKGGWGALQVNARYDYLNLNDDALQAGFNNNFTTGTSTASNSLSRGGKQQGIQAGLIWIPEDYVRFLLQYTHTKVTGGPFAAAVKSTSTDPIDERSYGVDSVAARAQIDF